MNRGDARVTNSTFLANQARGRGGAIFNVGTLSVHNSKFSWNYGEESGGGIYNGGAVTVTQSTFANNCHVVCIFGGAIENDDDATMTVRSSAFVDARQKRHAGDRLQRCGWEHRG